MLVNDIFKSLPNETGELLHIVEFIIYNTPGAHGFTPRDIDRRWSLSLPFQRELQPLQVNEFEPLEDPCSERVPDVSGAESASADAFAIQISRTS